MKPLHLLLILLLVTFPACRGKRDQRPGRRGPAPPFAHTVEPETIENGPATVPSEAVTELWINGDVLRTTDILQPVLPKLRQELAGLESANRQRAIWEFCSAQLVDEIRQLLLYQEARRELGDENMQLLERYVDQEIRARVNREFDGRESRMERHLEQMGMTMEDIRVRERRRILVGDYIGRHVRPQITNPSRHELLEYYQEHVENFTTAGYREMYLIDIPKADDAAGARHRIEQAEQRLASGEAFEEVARSLSTGIHAADGGRWGTIRSPLAGRYSAISNTLFSLSSGTTSEIIETDDAFFIVHVGTVVDTQTRSFEEVQPELVERYRNRQADQLVAKTVTELYEQATVTPDEESFLFTVAAAAEQALSEQ